MLDWPRAFEQHFARLFDKPFDVLSYRDGGQSLRVAVYDHAPGFARTYGSLGLSARPGLPPCEAVLCVDDRHPDVPFLFASALLFVLGNALPLQPPLAVGGVEKLRPAFYDLYDKAALYFTAAFSISKDDAALTRKQGDADVAASVVQAVFISEEEHDYLRQKGSEAFEARVVAQEADLTYLRRLPCV